MWVQIHNLPLGMTKSIYGKRFGKSIREVIKLDIDKDGMGWGPYLRVKVKVNVTKPLPKGCLTPSRDKPVWIEFKYERLLNFCFQCGIIKYPKLGCLIGQVGSKIHDNETSQYGTWLIASSHKSFIPQSPNSEKKKSLSGSSSFGMHFEEEKAHQIYNLAKTIKIVLENEHTLSNN